MKKNNKNTNLGFKQLKIMYDNQKKWFSYRRTKHLEKEDLDADKIFNYSYEGIVPFENGFYCQICNISIIDIKAHLIESSHKEKSIKWHKH
jgi:hypothetical protein